MIKHPLLWTLSLIGDIISVIFSTTLMLLIFIMILLFNAIDEIVESIEATDTRSRRMYRKMFRRRNE